MCCRKLYDSHNFLLLSSLRRTLYEGPPCPYRLMFFFLLSLLNSARKGVLDSQVCAKAHAGQIEERIV